MSRRRNDDYYDDDNRNLTLSERLKAQRVQSRLNRRENRQEARIERNKVREKGKEDRKSLSHEANLQLRNKVADIMLQDEDTRRAIVEGARDTASMLKKGLKITGIALLVGLGAFGIYKVVGSITKTSSQNKELNNMTKDLDEKKLTLPTEQFESLANSIYQAFSPTSKYFVFYDEDTITRILNKLGNKNDWEMLVKCFNKRTNGDGDYLTLPEFLRLDDDKADYQKILDKLSVFNVLT